MTIQIPGPDAPANQLNSVLRKLAKLPEAMRAPAFNLFFGRFSPFYASLRVKVVDITPGHVTLALRNRRRTRNHLRGIHAIAALLPAEYAAGLVCGQTVPRGSVVVVRGLSCEIRKPIRGDITATARLTDDQRAALGNQPKGDMKLAFTITGGDGEAPIEGVADMAWFPHKR